jgi:hypothetical protein
MWIAGNWHGLGLHASPVPLFIIKNEKKIGFRAIPVMPSSKYRVLSCIPHFYYTE